MWSKCDDKAWSNIKLRRAGRAARGLFWDLVSFAGDQRNDGFVEVVSLPQLETSAADPDLKVLVREGLLHKPGSECRCITKRGWEWPKTARGYLIHDFLDYSPSRAENDVVKAQRAELRDPVLRAKVRDRDYGRCRYCGELTNPNDRRGELGETLDHVVPDIADGELNLVLACRGCNSSKKKRTPEQACMVLLEVADVRALHYAELGITDPETTPELNTCFETDSEQTQVAEADGPGRVGSGSGRVGSGSSSQIGPPDTIRDSVTPNPYLRAGHADPALEPPPRPQARAPTTPARPRSQRPRKRKGRR